MQDLIGCDVIACSVEQSPHPRVLWQWQRSPINLRIHLERAMAGKIIPRQDLLKGAAASYYDRYGPGVTPPAEGQVQA
jgi:hypothetical protein